MYREKSKKHAQTQHLYDTLKKRILMSQVETAASENVAQTLKSISTRPGTYNGTGFAHAGASGTTGLRDQHASNIAVNASGVEQLHRHQRAGSGSHTSGEMAAMPPPDMIPSRNRIRRSRS